jgi:histidinol-phosphate aminotransferase
MKAIKPYLSELPKKSYEEDLGQDKGDILDCALGRNSFGTSQRVIEFARRYNDFSDLWHHPDTSYRELKDAICHFWSSYANLSVENIKVANGSCVTLSRLNKLFIGPKTRVLGYIPQFVEYMLDVKILGGYFHALELKQENRFKFDTEMFLNEMGNDYTVVYIDNPNNPTGQLLALEDIDKIVTKANKREMVAVIDEAYGDYVGEEHSAMNLLNDYKNLIVTRTFTKGYGIGRFRVGYAVMNKELSDYYDRISLPFSVSSMGAALAKQAISDHNFIVQMREKVKKEKAKIIDTFKKKGFIIGTTCDTCSIFVIGHPDKDVDLGETLRNKGIMTSSESNWQNMGKNWVRINTPRNADNFLFRLAL